MQKQSLSWLWSERGEPDSLIMKQTDIPHPEGDQVLIANKVIGLNPVDWKFIEQPFGLWNPGHIPGVDAMGVIVAVGEGERVNHLRVGSRVCYHTNLRTNGSFSQHTIVSAKAVIPVPDNVSDEAAAALPCPGLTAWQAMRKVPDLAGKHVLVSGAGGSVGSILTQLLVKQGAIVYATASKINHARLNQWGAVHSFDYKDDHWQGQLKQSLGAHSLYAAFDMVSGKHAETLGALLGYYGHLVCVQDRVNHSPVAAFSTCISLHEIALGAIHQHGSDKQWAELIHAGQLLLSDVGNGTLRLPRFHVDSFEYLPECLVKLKHNNQSIKFLIKTESD